MQSDAGVYCHLVKVHLTYIFQGYRADTGIIVQVSERQEAWKFWAIYHVKPQRKYNQNKTK